jgi:hypothetical protein
MRGGTGWLFCSSIVQWLVIRWLGSCFEALARRVDRDVGLALNLANGTRRATQVRGMGRSWRKL